MFYDVLKEKKCFIDNVNVYIQSPPQAPIFSGVIDDCGGRSPPENFKMLRIPPLRKWGKVSEGGVSLVISPDFKGLIQKKIITVTLLVVKET